MSSIVVFTKPMCPLCDMLKRMLTKMLKEKPDLFQYAERVSPDGIVELAALGITNFPVLEVDGVKMDFHKALNWIKENS